MNIFYLLQFNDSSFSVVLASERLRLIAGLYWQRILCII